MKTILQQLKDKSCSNKPSFKDKFISFEKQMNNLVTCNDDNYTEEEINSLLALKTDKTTTVNNKPLSSNIVLTKADIGLGNVDNTSDLNKPISTIMQTALDSKVDVILGMGLSTNDYTDAEKIKLSTLEELFRGVFVNEDDFPIDGTSGQYLYFDEGLDKDVVLCAWDISDNKFIPQAGESTSETPASIKIKYESNVDTNCFTNTYKNKLDIIDDRFNEKLNISLKNGNILKRRGLGLFSNENLDAVGMIAVKLPFKSSNIMFKYSLDLYTYDNPNNKNNAKLYISGYDYSGDEPVANPICDVVGNFKERVRFAYDDSNTYILLGDINTTWDFIKLSIDEVLSGYSGGLMGDNDCSISLLTSELGLNSIVECIINNVKEELSNKVDKEGDKVLSTNDFTDAEKLKLSGLNESNFIDKILEINSMNAEILACTSKDGTFIDGEEHFVIIYNKLDETKHASIIVKNKLVNKISFIKESPINTEHNINVDGLVYNSRIIKIDNDSIILIINNKLFKYIISTQLFDDNFRLNIETLLNNNMGGISASLLFELINDGFIVADFNKIIKINFDGTLNEIFSTNIESNGYFNLRNGNVNVNYENNSSDGNSVYLYCSFSNLNDGVKSIIKIQGDGNIDVISTISLAIEQMSLIDDNIYLIYRDNITNFYKCLVIDLNGIEIKNFNLNVDPNIEGLLQCNKILGDYLILGHIKYVMPTSYYLDLYDKNTYEYIKSLPANIIKVESIDDIIIGNTQYHNFNSENFYYADGFYTYFFDNNFNIINKIKTIGNNNTNNFINGDKMYNISLEGKLNVSKIEKEIVEQSYLDYRLNNL